jgi:hypothetical protein
MMRDAQIQEIVTRVLQTRLAARNFIDCEVKSEEDFDGESIIRVKARSRIPVEDAEERLGATMAIRDELRERGDDRYVFLNLGAPGDEPEQNEEERDEDFPKDARS